ncbi:MAG: sel1 repeat family protein [Ruminobacter sp.]|uniref:tetratricopeptide repeat protein n=1 Tax=Ruminobacter sp. TaxID=2774296 RepID=UPI001B7A85CC|nr:hypothetical protein [Ruminobacter sp.]MBP3748553.1 sel1 repeat family protein [Ruminobacter sp.]
MNWKKTWFRFLDDFDDWRKRLKNERGSLWMTPKGRMIMLGAVVVMVAGAVSIYQLNRYFTLKNYRALAELAVQNRFYEEAQANYEKLIKMGDVPALYEIASLYLEGKGTKKNTVLGLEYLRKAATAGYSPAQVRLGNLYYASGAEVSTCVGHDYKQAYEWFMKAGNNPDALDAIGEMYKRGLGGLNVDESMANSYFNRWIDIYVRRAEKGDVDAMRTLGAYFSSGSKLPVNMDKAVYWYEEASKKRDVSSIEALATIFRARNDLEKSNRYFSILEGLYRDMAKRGDNNAMLSLSDIYRIENTSIYNPEMSVEYLIKAAEHNNYESKLMMAELIEDGIINGDEYHTDPWALRYEARKLREEQAENGDISAMLSLGFDALTGTLISTDRQHLMKEPKRINSKKAIERAKKYEAAKEEANMVVIAEDKPTLKQDDEPVRLNFPDDESGADVSGDSSQTVAADDVISADEAQTGAASGDIMAVQNPVPVQDDDMTDELGLPVDESFLDGSGVILPDYEEAIKWFTMAAQHGEAKAMYELGSIYNDSSDFSKYYNPDTAVYWLKKSAELCYEPAYMSLGMIYNTKGFAREDAKEAQKWLTKAAMEGDHTAQKLLAESLAKGGMGAQPDMFHALIWTLVLKSYIGTFDTDSWYKDDIADMEKNYSYFLTPDQIQKANAEADILRSKYGSAW